MTHSQLSEQQIELCRHLRDAQAPAPADLETRRINVYRTLIFNNIEGFLSAGFPVFHSLLDEEFWRALVQRFIVAHRAHSPYFLDIGQEFLAYLQTQDLHALQLPAFTLELMHYEWVELALDVAPQSLPESLAEQVVTPQSRLTLSPLAWNLAYQFPVYRLGLEHQPEQVPEQPTFVVVYRNRHQQVKFMALNGLSSHLLNLIDQQPAIAACDLIDKLGNPRAEQVNPAGELSQFTQQAIEMMQRYVDADILLFSAQ